MARLNLFWAIALILSVILLGCAEESLIPTGAASAKTYVVNDSKSCAQTCVEICSSNTTCIGNCLSEKCIEKAKNEKPMGGITGSTSYYEENN